MDLNPRNWTEDWMKDMQGIMNIYWHRLLGLLLMDYLSNRGFRVELEKDLSLKRQYLDVVIVEREDEKADLSGICDGR